VASERGCIEMCWTLLQRSGFRILHLKTYSGHTPLDLCRQGRTFRWVAVALTFTCVLKLGTKRRTTDKNRDFYFQLQKVLKRLPFCHKYHPGIYHTVNLFCPIAIPPSLSVLGLYFYRHLQLAKLLTRYMKEPPFSKPDESPS
jgi:hypothetical protein